MAQSKRTKSGRATKPARTAGALGLVLLALVVVCLVVSLVWMRSPAPTAVTAEPATSTPTTVSDTPAESVAPLPVVVVDRSTEPLLSSDPIRVAAAAVDLRDDWFYAANDDLRASISEVFVAPGSPGALFVTNGVSLQRTAMWDAPEINKTLYFSEALAGRIVHAEPGSAIVEIWDVEVISRRELIEPQAQWGIQRLTLVRSEEDTRWLVSAWESESGPAPGLTVGQRTATATEMELDLEGHGRIRGWLGIDDVEATS